MANNQANDRYNPPSVNDPDFESFRLSEIPIGQLFWRYNDDRSVNHAFRKLTDDVNDNVLNTKSQQVITIPVSDIIYQKI